MKISDLRHIDIQNGLSHMDGNKELYLSILHDFYKSYIDFKIENTDKKEFHIHMHTLKGLCATIGAYELHKIVAKLDKADDTSLYKSLNNELYNVLGELKSIEYNKKQTSPLLVDELQKEKLFVALQTAIKNEIPKECNDICVDLENLQLSNGENELLQSIKTSLFEFDFDNALGKINQL